MSTEGPRKPHGATRRRKVVGRGAGSGKGATAGRGTKGQNSRSGGKVRPGFEGGQMPLFRRVARRGFSNVRFQVPVITLGLDDLGRAFKEGDVVDGASLIAKGLVDHAGDHVKILANGSLEYRLEVRVNAVSASARQRIEAVGGTVTTESGTTDG